MRAGANCRGRRTSLTFCPLVSSSSRLLQSFNHGALPTPTPSHSLSSSFSTSASVQAKARGRKVERVHRDPFYEAQAARLKTANLARQEVLKKERADTLGDPIASKTTPFIQSIRQNRFHDKLDSQDGAQSRNFYVKPDELKTQLDNSRFLTEPLSRPFRPDIRDDDATRRQKEQSHRENFTKQHVGWEEADRKAKIALERITSLNIASSKDQTRLNIQRCIEEFGRHRTDMELPPRPQGPAQANAPTPEHPRLRAGPDTGSSEVQVSILTTKIDKLAEHTRMYGHKDKHNKRNLRLLVHRRQKLLKYLRQKERGGPRFANLMEKLGLSEAAWKGEISI